MLDRIFITGRAGAGKTTLGVSLEQTMARDVAFSDVWEARLSDVNRTRKDNVNECVKEAKKVAEEPRWIVESGVHHFLSIFLPRATTVILLDLPIITAVGNIAKRRIFGQYTDKDGVKSVRRELHNMVAASTVFPILHQKTMFDIINDADPAPILIHLASIKEIRKFGEDLSNSAPENYADVFEAYSSAIPQRQELGWSGKIVKDIMRSIGRDTHQGL